jgi:hypothetical protein
VIILIPAPSCGSWGTLVGSTCYKVFTAAASTTTLSYSAAKAKCEEKLGRKLAAPRTQEIMDALLALAGGKDAGEKFWVGLDDM